MTINEEVELDADIAYEANRVNAPKWKDMSDGFRDFMRRQQRAVIEARASRALEAEGY